MHGEVERPLTLDFARLLTLPQTEQLATSTASPAGRCSTRAGRACASRSWPSSSGLKPTARYVVFEAANGYTANVRLAEAMAPDVLVAYQLDGRPLPRPHGPPARAIVPGLYFWKSAKWLTGVKFVAKDEPGYWETRGYHNHADPWHEERYG